MATIHEECGVFGVCVAGMTHAASVTYNALYALQHRGQESAGMAINDDGVITSHKDVGLVSEVFTPEILEHLGPGSMAVGHVRYATTGAGERENAQPLTIKYVKGTLAVVHNGNLVGVDQLRRDFEYKGAIFHTTSDSELIAYAIAQARLHCRSVEDAVCYAARNLKGAFSLLVMSPRKLIACRDPWGFRPLCMGRKGDAVLFASESCAIASVGGELERELEPGEIVVVEDGQVRSIRDNCRGLSHMCIFEYIYFARPDSVIDGSSVHVARQRAGAFLALEHPVQADIVIGVPDSGLDAALGYARQSGIPYGIGFIKNKYIGRTFISPTQAMRENEVNIKLNPIRSVVEGKRVVLIDDSIVRGTTCRRTIQLLRKAGAKEIHMRVSAPPFVAACYYGTDIDDPTKLIANNHSVEEIAEIIGVDSLGYLSLQDVVKLADNTECGFCTACFGGGYPTAVPRDGGKDRFECKISERGKC